MSTPKKKKLLISSHSGEIIVEIQGVVDSGETLDDTPARDLLYEISDLLLQFLITKGAKQEENNRFRLTVEREGWLDSLLVTLPTFRLDHVESCETIE